ISPTGGHPRQVGGGGGEQTLGDLLRARPARAFELAFLQSPQQLGLQLQRDVAALVQKQRAFVRQFEPPDALRDRASERAPFVAEELAFEQAGRNRRAVHLDQSALAAITEIVDRMGDQFFTCAGFALNQDRRIGRGDDSDLLERAGERRTLADDLREIELALNLFFQVDLFAGQFVLQRFDLVESQRVFNRDGYLVGDLAEQFGVLRGERVVPQTAHGHYS